MIGNALWYLPGGETANVYADDYYKTERTQLASSSRTKRWVGKVAIMYPSDYGYATELSLCKNTGLYYYDINNSVADPNCVGTDWLYNAGWQWLLSYYPQSGTYVWYLRDEGFLQAKDIPPTENWNVRPVVVLKSNVAIFDGEGTSENPYKLRLN